MKGEDPARVLTHLIETYEKLLALEDEDDPDDRKIAQIVATTLSLLLGQISPENKTLSVEVSLYSFNFPTYICPEMVCRHFSGSQT